MQFHLHPSGSDLNDGLTAGKTRGRRGPWATLAGARDALRRLREAGRLRGEATVVVHPGTYRIAEPVEFGPADSHTRFVAAKPGRAVFDGAEELAGWREERHNGRRAWVLDLPEVAAGRRHFRSVFVGGERRPRARLPKFSPDAEGVHKVMRIGRLRFPEKRKLFDGDNVFAPAEGDVQDWPSLKDAEVVLLHYWIETRLGTARFDPATGWLECARKSVFNLYESFNDKLARYYIDNLKEALTDPGEWYLERSSGRLVYLPLPGERLGRTRVQAPLTTAFIRVNGTAFNHDTVTADPLSGRPVENLRFEGLAFRHTDWFHPQADFLPHNNLREDGRPLGSAPQGAANIPAVLEFRHARGCCVDNCAVSRVGFTAVEFGPGCRDCRLTRSTLEDLGAGGVRIDGSELDGAPADRTTGIRVEDNTIRHIGRIFQQGIGVLLMRAARCTVAHNEISHTCYTGVSCGWVWGYRETVTRDIVIENNYIHDIGQGVLSDMGGIYLLGVQPGTVLRGNHIHSVTSADYGGWGIYPDEGSSHILIEHNWVHDTQGSPLRIHFGRELVVRDNVFSRSAQEGLIGIGHVEGHIAACLVNNLLIGPAPALFEGGYAGDVRRAFRSDANLVWFPGGKTAPCRHPEFRKDVPRAVSWKQWQAAGHDRASHVADPRSRETGTAFTLPASSPALQTGFRPYDWSACGPRR